MKLLVTILALFMNAANPVSDVEKSVEELRLLMITPVKDQLDKITHEKLTYGHSSGKVESKAEFIETLVSGKSDFRKIEFKNQSVQEVGNTAIVRHILEAETFDGGVANSIRIQVVLVWVKDNNNWKLLARQAIKI